MVLSDVNKMFCQCMLTKRFVSEGEALQLLGLVSGRDLSNKNELEKVVEQINKSIKKFHIEIKSQVCDVTFKNYYVIVSNFSSPDEFYDKCVHAYSQGEREYFRNILEEIITSDERCIRRNNALNLSVAGNSQSQSWGPSKYNQILLKFIEDGWLISNDDNGKLFLGARAIAELEHLLLSVYKVDGCKLCSRVCIVGFVCDKCNISAHEHCLRIFRGKKAVNNKCVKCGNEMRRL